MDLLAATSALFDVVYPVLAGTAIAMARALGMIVITPAFVRLGLTGLIRSGVAIAIALPLIPSFTATLAEGQGLSTLVVTGLILKEIILGRHSSASCSAFRSGPRKSPAISSTCNAARHRRSSSIRCRRRKPASPEPSSS